jgi:hypothetical protein
MRSIFRKLDVASRAELAGLLGAHRARRPIDNRRRG